MSLLLPDPADPNCPEAFKYAARNELRQFRVVGPSDEDLKRALLAFVSDLSDWQLVGKTGYISIARKLIEAAHDDSPHVFDPFSGGGSIPLEGQRLGCEVTASELNPVAWLLLKIVLEWSGRKGVELARLFEQWSQWVLEEVERRLATFYPTDAKRRKPLAYLWARTIQCEAPVCGAVIHLIRNLWLSQASKRTKALRITYKKGTGKPTIDVFAPKNDREVLSGTVDRFRATCPKCRQPIPRERVQAQLVTQNGGTGNSVMLAVIRSSTSPRHKDYYAPTLRDIRAYLKSIEQGEDVEILLPPAPPTGDTGFRPRPYGITNWADVLTSRQRYSRWIIHEVIEDGLKEVDKEVKDQELLVALAACLYVAYSDNAQYHTSLCVWLSEGVTSIFIQGSGIPMRADFVEGSPLSPNCEGLEYSIKSVQAALNNLGYASYSPSSPLLANVSSSSSITGFHPHR